MNNRYHNLNIVRKALIDDMRSIALVHTAIELFMLLPSKKTLDVLSRKLKGMLVLRALSRLSVLKLTLDIVLLMEKDKI